MFDYRQRPPSKAWDDGWERGKMVISLANMHPDLTDMCVSLLKDTKLNISMDGGGDYGFGLTWKRITNNWANFVIGMDEDAFLLRPDSLFEMIDYMRKNEIGFCGMPENGVSCQRKFSDRYMNPFFNIWNLQVIKEKGCLDEIAMKTYDPDVPFRESTWGIYAYLKDHGVPFKNLEGSNHKDNVTVILKDFNGKDFLYHTWLAREWDGKDKDRIASVYNEVKSLRGI